MGSKSSCGGGLDFDLRDFDLKLAPGESDYTNAVPAQGEVWDPERYVFFTDTLWFLDSSIQPDPGISNSFAYMYSAHDHAPIGATSLDYCYMGNDVRGDPDPTNLFCATITYRVESEAHRNLDVRVTPGGRVTGPGPLDCREGGEGPCLLSYPKDQDVTIVAQPSAGYECGAWAGSCGAVSAADPCEVTVRMDQHRACAITFEPAADLVDFRVDIIGEGAVTVEEVGGSNLECSEAAGAVTCLLVPDTLVNLRATASVSSRFVGWGGACEGLSSTDTITGLRVGEAMQCEALFEERAQFGFRIEIDGLGEVHVTSPVRYECISNERSTGCTLVVYEGQQITMTAMPLRRGDGVESRFVEWQGDCQGTEATMSVRGGAATMCRAVFVPILSEDCSAAVAPTPQVQLFANDQPLSERDGVYDVRVGAGLRFDASTSVAGSEALARVEWTINHGLGAPFSTAGVVGRWQVNARPGVISLDVRVTNSCLLSTAQTFLLSVTN